MIADEIYRFYFKTGTLSREELLELCKTDDVSAADSSGNMPLHAAARFADDEAAEILLSRSADPNAQNNYHDTPLDILAGLDRVSSYQAPPGKMYRFTVLLLDAKANPHKKDSSDKTCYLKAAANGNWELIQAFCDKGTRLKGIANGGENGLHITAYNARRAVDKVNTAQKYIDQKKAEV